MKIKTFLLIIFALLLIVSCKPKEERKTLAEKAGNSIGSALTDFASGVGEGIDQKQKIKVELSDQLKELGLSVTTSKTDLDDIMENQITIYLISEKDTHVKIIAKALDSENQEIGRSSVEVKMKADDADYVPFSFSEKMDSQLVTKYVLSLRK